MWCQQLVRGLFLLAVVGPAAAAQSWLGSGWPIQEKDTTPATLVVGIAPQVSHTLSLWYREFETEFLGCLYGSTGMGPPDTILILMVVPADVRPVRSTPNSVTPNALCGDRYGFLLGEVHSHPAIVTDFQGRRFRTPDKNLCFASPRDLESFAEDRYVLMMVACGQDRLAVYLRWATNTRHLCTYDARDFIPRCTWTKETQGSGT